MTDLIEQIYLYLQENLNPDFEGDPEYRRLQEKDTKLTDALAAELGEGGKQRLEELWSVQGDLDHFWGLLLFRRTLALGMALGRLAG